MIAQQDEAKRLRIRDAASVDAMSRSGRDPSMGMPCLVARTTTLATYPQSAGVFYACSPINVLGAEVEGGSANLTIGASTFFAINLGSAIPPVGTNIVATFVDHRWVFRFDG